MMRPKPEKPMWTLTQALDLVRDVECALASAGWHCALAGGVLHRGQSSRDLDVIVYPRAIARDRRPNIEEMRAALRGIGMSCRVRRIAVLADWRKRGIADNKWVEVWRAPDGVRRVDLLVLS